MAEGINLQMHRNTWRYTRLLEHQRELILEWRDKVLHGRRGGRAPRRAADPERWASEPGGDPLRETARQIVLHAIDTLLDRAPGVPAPTCARASTCGRWAGSSPIDEFQREAVAEYKALQAEIERRSRAAFEAPAPDLKRPEATWTYLVQDNPFGSDWDRDCSSGSRAVPART